MLNTKNANIFDHDLHLKIPSKLQHTVGHIKSSLVGCIPNFCFCHFYVQQRKTNKFFHNNVILFVQNCLLWLHPGIEHFSDATTMQFLIVGFQVKCTKVNNCESHYCQVQKCTNLCIFDFEAVQRSGFFLFHNFFKSQP